MMGLCLSSGAVLCSQGRGERVNSSFEAGEEHQGWTSWDASSCPSLLASPSGVSCWFLPSPSAHILGEAKSSPAQTQGQALRCRAGLRRSRAPLGTCLPPSLPCVGCLWAGVGS